VTAGLDTLAALRRTGRQPKSVDVDTDCVVSPKLRRRIAELNAYSGDVCWNAAIGTEETVGRVDLRPLQGLVCTVGGIDVDRVAAVAAACHEAGAARVIGCTYRKDRVAGGLRVQLTHQTDTEGVMVYAEIPA
jgi:glycine/D-amino acid oxidase-like deaminating enzyme